MKITVRRRIYYYLFSLLFSVEKTQKRTIILISNTRMKNSTFYTTTGTSLETNTNKQTIKIKTNYGEQEWCNGQDVRLRPFAPGFEFRTRHPEWFVRPCPEGFLRFAAIHPFASFPSSLLNLYKFWFDQTTDWMNISFPYICHCLFRFVLLLLCYFIILSTHSASKRSHHVIIFKTGRLCTPMRCLRRMRTPKRVTIHFTPAGLV